MYYMLPKSFFIFIYAGNFENINTYTQTNSIHGNITVKLGNTDKG